MGVPTDPPRRASPRVDRTPEPGPPRRIGSQVVRSVYPSRSRSVTDETPHRAGHRDDVGRVEGPRSVSFPAGALPPPTDLVTVPPGSSGLISVSGTFIEGEVPQPCIGPQGGDEDSGGGLKVRSPNHALGPKSETRTLGG